MHTQRNRMSLNRAYLAPITPCPIRTLDHGNVVLWSATKTEKGITLTHALGHVQEFTLFKGTWTLQELTVKDDMLDRRTKRMGKGKKEYRYTYAPRVKNPLSPTKIEIMKHRFSRIEFRELLIQRIKNIDFVDPLL